MDARGGQVWRRLICAPKDKRDPLDTIHLELTMASNVDLNDLDIQCHMIDAWKDVLEWLAGLPGSGSLTGGIIARRQSQA